MGNEENLQEFCDVIKNKKKIGSNTWMIEEIGEIYEIYDSDNCLHIYTK